MRNIRISDAVDRYIEKHGKFGENYDDVLRRLFKLPSTGVPPSPAETTLTASVARRTRREIATREMKAGMTGTTLSVGFENEAPRTWELPHNKQDKAQIRRIRDLATEYAVGRGATDGQRNAVGKAISEAGYYLTRPQIPGI